MNTLLHDIFNKTFSNSFVFFLTIFIFYIIFEHLLELTKFVVEYNSSYDYGKYVKSVCYDEFVEYETSRFHINESAKYLRLQNTANYGRYMIFILILTIIITLFISMLFAYVLNNSLYNKNWFDKLYKTNDELKEATTIKKITTFLLNFSNKILPIGFIYKYTVEVFLKNENKFPIWKNIILFVLLLLIQLLISITFLIMPIYIGLMLNNDINISPFTHSFSVYIPYIVCIVLIVLLRLSYLVFTYDSIYIESIDPIKEYFSDHINNIFTTNSFPGYVAFFTLFAVYISMFLILGNIINQYKNWENTKMKYYEEDTSQNVNIKPSILLEYLNDIFGFKETNKFDDHYNFDKMSGIIFIIIIIICSLLLIYALTKNENNSRNLMKYGMIIPLVFLLTILIITQINTQYNTIVNKYIIDNTNTIYKQYIDILNRMFNKILLSEYPNGNNENTVDYVCRNVGNAILSTLYSNLFNNIEIISRIGDESNDKNINVTPEFSYSKDCNALELFNFTNNTDYDISYYLYAKTFKKNIFYNFASCSSINDKVFKTFEENLQIFQSSQQNVDYLEILKDQIGKKLFSSTKVVTKDPIQYIKNVIINQNNIQDIQLIANNLKSKIKRQLNHSVSNILNKYTYYSGDNILLYYIYYDEHVKSYFKNDLENNIVDLSIYEIHQNNNKLYNNLQETENIVPGYDDVLDKISDIYMDNIYYYLYASAKYPNMEKFPEQKDLFINILIDGIKKTFTKINETLSSAITINDNKPITKYIITNHNNIFYDNMFKRNRFKIIEDTYNNDADTFQDKLEYVQIFYDLLKQIMKNFNEISLFNNIVDIDAYNIDSFQSSLQKYLSAVESIKDSLMNQKFNNEQFKSSIKTIMNNKEKYIMSYDIKILKNNNTFESKIINIEDGNVYDMIYKMNELMTYFLNDIEHKKNEKLKYENRNKEVYNTLTTNIKHYIYHLNNNLKNLDSDIKSFFNFTEYNFKNTQKLENISIDLSKNTLLDSQKVDQMIYFLIVIYIVPIFLTNFIYYL